MNHDNPEDNHTQQDNTPASVVFMEMMRQAASSRRPVIDDDNFEAEHHEEPPEIIDEAHHRAIALEAERVRRVKRRQEKQRRRTVGMLGGYFQTLVIVFISGSLIATILSWWTTPQSLNTDLQVALGHPAGTPIPQISPTPQPTPNWLKRIGIVSGHRGPEGDPGAICADERGEIALDENGVPYMTENEVNFQVATRVWELLRAEGYTVDLLDEFDERLIDYQAAALVSIHANDCQDYGEQVSGYLIAHAEARPEGGEDTRLVQCISRHYAAATQLELRPFGLTRDMVDYHAFREIRQTTPGAIIELGFLLGDQELLTTQPDVMAQGIVDGILCFMNPGNEPVLPVTPTPVPGA